MTIHTTLPLTVEACTMKSEPTVFVVDDDATVRDGLRCLLESVHLPVRTYANAQEFLEGYDSTCGGCLVVDVRMPGMSGLGVCPRINRCFPIALFCSRLGSPAGSPVALAGAQTPLGAHR
jgi:CheY-like chemotaxis protein